MARPRQSVVKIDGLTRVIKLMGRGAEEVTPALKEALYKEAQDILREARVQVPYLYGALSSSGRIHTAYVVGNTTAVEITFGGAAGGELPVNYAIIQHENEKFKHAEGRKAKYLEDPALDAADGFANRLGNRIENILRKANRAEQQEDQDLI
jgi:hypothetical protein